MKFFTSSEYDSWPFLHKLLWDASIFPKWEYFTGILTAHIYSPDIVVYGNWAPAIFLMIIFCFYGAIIEYWFNRKIIMPLIFVSMFFSIVISQILNIFFDMHVMFDFTNLILSFAGFTVAFYFFNLKVERIRKSFVAFWAIIPFVGLIPLSINAKTQGTALAYFAVGLLFYIFAVKVFKICNQKNITVNE